jgi:hypothetical protein
VRTCPGLCHETKILGIATERDVGNRGTRHQDHTVRSFMTPDTCEKYSKMLDDVILRPILQTDPSRGGGSAGRRTGPENQPNRSKRPCVRADSSVPGSSGPRRTGRVAQ